MNFYHWWIYTHILNATWFVWTIVVFVFLFNVIGPILIWLRINSKSIPFLQKKQKGEQAAENAAEN